MTPRTRFGLLASPLGELLAVSDGTFLTGLYTPGAKGKPEPAAEWTRDDSWFESIHERLLEYFAGRLSEFDIPVRAAGTPFQEIVWAELMRIPYATTITYGELARRVGDPKSSRAVGAANGRNPIAIIVPCHRVIGANGSMTGYAGGVDTKRKLLDLERNAFGRLTTRAS
jgi:methylated-DNA-[protein]-cysteine S-methyltransferase